MSEEELKVLNENRSKAQRNYGDVVDQAWKVRKDAMAKLRLTRIRKIPKLKMPTRKPLNQHEYS